MNASVENQIHFHELHPQSKTHPKEVLEGLKSVRKNLNPKFFYDTKGSELFEVITNLEEYYPTRTERKIFETYSQDIAEVCGIDSIIIEPGSGSCEKIQLLIPNLKPKAYIPIDIAGDFLLDSVNKLAENFPELPIHAVQADFNQLDNLPNELPNGSKLVFYPGSTIGNMEPEKALEFLIKLSEWIGNDGGILLGVDLHKPAHQLNAAYNDQQGVTEAFNLNALDHLNDIFEANFNKENFSHKAFYNEQLYRIEMHLVSDCEQCVEFEGEKIQFDEGESIHTENSYKYTRKQLSSLAADAGLTLKETWLDENELFSVNLLVRA
ncbi:L-histidine N(alpha)-methyltransferase [Sessilibacter corallicola]|uniref:L-histidine N(Alpha)-methyltransferase n=1 Tax=Sessilibacter corallicola TaxID=2904075 RepID=A0ABQ0A458_9GAMM